MNRLIIGLGSGRCGTMSLVKLLGLQQNCYSLHEPKPLLPWIVSEAVAQKHLDRIRWPVEVAAVAAFYYLPYVEWFEQHAGCPVTFVCLQREKQATVESFMQWTELRVAPPRNHWMNHNGTHWTHTEWDKCFPKYKVADKSSAILRYYEGYYEQAERLAEEKSNFRIFPMDTLNHRGHVRELLKFCGFSRPEVKAGIKAHHKPE